MATEKFAPDAVRRLNPLENPNWDALLTSRPDFSFFHGAAWARVLMDTYGFKPFYFFAGDAGAPATVLPLMEVDSWLTGKRGIALPFTDACPPLGIEEKSFGKVFAEVVRFGKSRGWKHVELRGAGNLLDAPVSVSFYGHGLQLAGGEKVLFEKMNSSARKAVRKAEKDGVTVEISQSVEAVRDFYQLQCLTRRRHGLPPQPWSFFVNVHRHILSQHLGMITTAAQGGKKLAAAVYFFLGGRAIYKYGASDLTRQHLRGPNLVMWEAMKWLARNGASHLNLGKTSLGNEGLRRFKLNLGAHEETVTYLKYDLRREQFVTEPDGVEGWHNVVFRTLPVFASRAAGSLLYRHWA